MPMLFSKIAPVSGSQRQNLVVTHMGTTEYEVDHSSLTGKVDIVVVNHEL